MTPRSLDSTTLRRCQAAFETEPCGRCGGSGTFSRCQTWGTTCFDCGYSPGVPGTGRRYTRRGRAALARFLELLPTKCARDLNPGDRIVESGRTYTVLSLTMPSTSARYVNGVRVSEGYLDIVTPKIVFALVPEDALQVVVPTPEALEAALVDAVAYQNAFVLASEHGLVV